MQKGWAAVHEGCRILLLLPQRRRLTAPRMDFLADVIVTATELSKNDRAKVRNRLAEVVVKQEMLDRAVVVKAGSWTMVRDLRRLGQPLRAHASESTA